jgi:hypothetical protein
MTLRVLSLRADESCSVSLDLLRWYGCVREFCVQAIPMPKSALHSKNSKMIARRSS